MSSSLRQGTGTQSFATAFVPMRDRQQEWAARLRMVQEARQFVYLSTYFIEFDAYGRALLAALIAAVDRGVHVCVVNDAFGQKLSQTLMTGEALRALDTTVCRLASAGGDFEYRTANTSLGRWAGGGHHVKIQVSDGGQALIGSSNITHRSFEQWNEFTALLEGPIVGPLLRGLYALGCEPNAAARELEAVCGAAPRRGIPMEYWQYDPLGDAGPFEPLLGRGENPLTDRLVRLIDSANERVFISSFYFKPAPPLLRAILRARERGCAVEIYHSHRCALDESDLPWLSAARTFEALSRRGILIFENLRGEHSKLVLVDGQEAAFGSYNLEHAAHDRLTESMVFSRAAECTTAVEQCFREMRSDPMNRAWITEYPAGLPLYRRVQSLLLFPLHRWI